MATISTKTLMVGQQAVFDRLDRVAAAASDLHPCWDDIGGLFAARERAVFAASAWPPFAAVTLRTHQSPLVDTGIMREGLTGNRPIWSKDKAAAWGADKGDRRVMNPAVLHTVGTSRMPKRPPVPRLRAAEKHAWTDVVRKHIGKAIKS